MARIKREFNTDKNVVVTSLTKVEDLRSLSISSSAPKCALSGTLQTFIMDTLKQSVTSEDLSSARRRNRVRRHKPRSRPSTLTFSTENYETQFPALSSKTSVLNVPTNDLPQPRYSEIAARQFEINSMTSNAGEAPFSSSLPPVSPVPCLKQTRERSRAVHSWMVGANRTLTTPNRALLQPKSFIRTTFDKLFCSNKKIAVSVSTEVPKLEKIEIVSLLRQSLSKVNNTQLLLPDYHLNRLIQSNPSFIGLIQQSQKHLKSQRTFC